MLTMTSQGRMRLLALMVAAALGFALWSAQASHAVACSTTWNGATADWSTAADWDNGLPDANSIVCISSGHPTVTTDAVVAELRLSGSATLTVDDSHVYTDDPSTGDFPDGPMTVASGATLQETGAASEL